LVCWAWNKSSVHTNVFLSVLFKGVIQDVEGSIYPYSWCFCHISFSIKPTSLLTAIYIGESFKGGDKACFPKNICHFQK
jgi:hypothetical protein